MIRSMTGYGRFEGVINGRMTVFEIKAVNHRYLELQCRVPRSCGFLEEKIRELVSSRINRGKIDVFVSVEADENIAADVRVNHSLAAGYVSINGVEASIGVQTLGAFAVAAFAFVLGLGVFLLIKKTHGLRVEKRIEEEGLDVYEHGEACYN